MYRVKFGTNLKLISVVTFLYVEYVFKDSRKDVIEIQICDQRTRDQSMLYFLH